VWRRQVGLVRGTWWPADSSAGRMVARTARCSHGRFLSWTSKPMSSLDYMGVESWVKIGVGYTEFAGSPVVHQKTTGFLGWSTKPRLKTKDGGAAASDWCDWWVWPVCDNAVRRLRSGEHAGDRKVCVEAKQVCGRWASVWWCDNKVSQKALRGHVS
jgi:hypothetical protein